MIVANDAAQSFHDLEIAAGDVMIGTAMDTGGGDFISSGVNFDNTSGAITVAELTMNYTGAITLGDLLSASATLDVTAAGCVNITTTGQLSGAGVITGDVNNSGTIAPGNTPGIINVTGNYMQQASGTLEIDVEGTTNAIPEPSSIVLCMFGLVVTTGIVLRRRLWE